MRCIKVNLGKMRFADAWKIQRRLANLRIAGDLDDLLLLVEHPPVITIGRAGDAANIRVSLSSLEDYGIELVEVDRGGDVTYHGPGQLVGYPILDLTRHGRDLHLYIYNLEEHLIRLLATYGIRAGRVSGLTGVWVGEEKVAAIGVHVKKWVSTHGYALNVSPRMDHWHLIHQCGIRDRKVTALSSLIGREVDMAEVRERASQAFEEVFEVRMEEMPLSKLLIEADKAAAGGVLPRSERSC